MYNNLKIPIYFFFIGSLFLGLYFGENSSGGGKIDHEYLFPFILNFNDSFLKGLITFIENKGSLIHSPAFYILISYLYSFTENIIHIKIIYILISSILPFLFFLILSEKFRSQNFSIFLFSLVIFLSPYFRSSTIWILGDNLSLLFLATSILFLIKKKISYEKRFYDYLLSLIFLILCCYVRYYYCIYFLYYLFIYFKYLKKNDFIKILLYSFFLSIPAIGYFLFVILNYDFLNTLSTFGTINYFSNSLIILSILLFYLIPIIILKRKEFIQFFLKSKINIVFILTLSICSFFIDYFIYENLINFSNLGGGFFIKFLKISDIDNSILLLFSAISLIALDFIFKEDRINNYLILIILVVSLPLYSIFQKYLDPLFYFLFFGLINSRQINKNFICNIFNSSFLLAYYFIFFVTSIFYYEVIL